MQCLATACLLVPFCFFAAPNNLYRGILLLLAVPGLLHLRTVVDDGAVRPWLGQITFALIFVLWGQFFQHALTVGSPDSSLLGPVILLRAGFWFVREAVWWWLIAGLLSITVSCLRGLPLTQELFQKLRWLRREPAL